MPKLKTPLFPSALQPLIVELRQPAWDTRWIAVLRARCPKESVQSPKRRSQLTLNGACFGVCAEQTIGDVRGYCDGQAGGAAYTLRTAFPAMAYEDNSQTLKAAQLVPNATMMMRVQQ